MDEAPALDVPLDAPPPRADVVGDLRPVARPSGQGERVGATEADSARSGTNGHATASAISDGHEIQAAVETALALVHDDLAAAEEALLGLLGSAFTPIPSVGEHVALAGGKRFRPLLTLLAARAAGYQEQARVTVAAVGELLHTATLLHDDVVDDAAFRRGRPAARVAWGNGMAVLVGDYCLARGLQAIGRLGSIAAVQTLADTVTAMAEGEVAQLWAAGDVEAAGLPPIGDAPVAWISPDRARAHGNAALDVHARGLDAARTRYDAIVERKTAALIAWCASVGGLVEGPPGAALRQYGSDVGHAFQIADDVLDYQSSAQVSGKDPARDLAEGKFTLPLLIALERDPSLGRLLAEHLAAGGRDHDRIASIVARVRGVGADAAASQAAMERAARGVAALDALPDSPARSALAGVARHVARRRR